MKILVACEESQRVTDQFRRLGHEAYSCDILPTSGDHPGWHIQDDIRYYLDLDWDMVIAFPPCTHLTITGERWFYYGYKPLSLRIDAMNFFMMFTNLKSKHVCIENPIGIMSTYFRKPDQIISPYMFGDPYEKKTCLWLKNLPLLKPTDIVEVPERIKFQSGKTMPKWYADLWAVSDPAERSRLRSQTFPGIAKAMADQWGNI